MSSILRRGLLAATVFFFGSLTSLSAIAEPSNGVMVAEPVAKGLGLQPGVSPVRVLIDALYGELNWLIAAITIFVFLLLLYTVIRYHRVFNKVPSTTTHHVKLEIVWTLLPVIILAIIAVPSLTLLYYEDRTPNPEMTLKVTGHQWYWSYEYPDNGNVAFDARPIWVSPQTTAAEVDSAIADAKPSWLIDNGAARRLLETDNRIVLPIDTNVRVLIAGADVIHSWSMPSVGVKRDAVPGRLNETWLRIDREGVYYGQCSEICGAGHGFMPIVIEAVTKEKFASWVSSQHAKGNGMEKPAEVISDSAKATAQPIVPLGGDTTEAAPMVAPGKAAIPADAAPLDKTPAANPAATDNNGASTGGVKNAQ